MIVARTTELAEQLLPAGDLRCPRCEVGQLTAWGYGRRRTIRSHGSATLTIRPRRTRCASCLRTHIVMPAQLQPPPRRHYRGDRHSTAAQGKWARTPPHRNRHGPPDRRNGAPAPSGP
ncbi:DUF6431 domain-containing protein [Mycobacterium sp.]|uniref:DUF6431 domain-containing protein n=1 Tax=Mycobacterium sp. TaxID=1785 RepID=UPI0031DEF113